MAERDPRIPDQTEETSGGGPFEFVRAVPGLTRIAAVAWLRTAEWGLETSMRAGSRVLKAAVAGESPAELFQDAGSELREYARRVLDLAGADNGVVSTFEPSNNTNSDDARAETSRPTPADPDGTPASLRERGAELLRRSAEVGFDEEAHPAYARILDQLAPDEGRILRLLALEGPQASVDVRSGRWLNQNELVAPGLNIIDLAAGCRNPERVPVYLNNLNRLGLVWFSREPLDDINRYQVLESQPHVAEAMEKAGRGRTVRRSIRLTPFGSDFCDACLPLHTAELDQLPASGLSTRDSSSERSPREQEGSPSN
jgi:abortive infection alpha-like protein